MQNKLSVRQLNTYIKNVFEDELVLQNITVIGEISEVSFSKYTFITLKEGDCLLSCVCFGRIDLPETGQRVALTGSVKYSDKFSKISFVFKNIEIIGNGLYQTEYLKLKEKLKNAGYFDKKLPLPSFITNVCIITSGYGSVVHDFISGIADGHSYIDINVYRSSVQGESAEKELCASLKKADGKFDVVVLARGGGSAEDLACFNSESVAAAVGKMKIPVISAVGHETDFTLCDLCASYRTGTPSYAAKKITENNAAVISKFIELVRMLGDAAERKIKLKSSRLALLTARTIFAASNEINLKKEKLSYLMSEIKRLQSEKMQSDSRRIENYRHLLDDSINKAAETADKSFSRSVVQLEYLNPLKILSRGYSVVTGEGRTLNSANELKAGDKINIKFYEGSVSAKVLEKED